MIQAQIDQISAAPIGAQQIAQPYYGPEGLEFRLYDYLALIRKRFGLIAMMCLAPTLVCALIVFAMTPVYTAHSTVEITDTRPKILDDVQDLIQQTTNADQHDFYKTEFDVLRSRKLAAQVILSLGIDRSPFLNPPQQSDWYSLLMNRLKEFIAARGPVGVTVGEASPLGVTSEIIDRYLKHLSIEPLLGTRLVSVGFTTPDADLSARIVNAHVQAYIRRGIELNAQANRVAAEYLEKNLEQLADNVQSSEAALNDYRRARGIVSFSVENKNEVLQARMIDLNNQLTAAETQRIELEAKNQLIKDHNYDALSEVRQSLLIQNLREQLGELSAQYAALLNRYNPGYHPLDDAKAKMDESRVNLNHEIDVTVQGVVGDYNAAIAQEESIKQAIDAVKDEAMAEKDDSTKETVLSRNLETNQRLYDSVLKRLQEMGVAASVRASNVSVVDEAEPTRIPSSPKIARSLLLTGMLGVTAGLLCAFALEYLDDTLKSKEEAAAYLRLPILGVVADFTKPSGRGSRYGYDQYYHSNNVARGDLEVSAGATTNTAGLNGEIVTSSERKMKAMAETYRVVRTGIQFSRAGNAPKIVMISSSLSREGKTVTALNTSIVFAQLGKTLLIDADLRRGRCHEVLSLKNDHGLSEVLVGQMDLFQAILPTSIAHLDLLPAGTLPPNPAELLGSPKMREILSKLVQHYDHVILDSAPLLVSDSLTLATLVDGVMFIAGNRTPKHIVKDGCAQFSHVGARIFGVILNRLHPRSMGYPAYYRDNYSHYSN
jgi:succinoglycan biosynthesis transport protein ExoP